jgi:hypothetical protein
MSVTTKKEAVMGQAIPSHHPAVVLRSRYQQLRALLAVAMIALVGLTVAVVVLALDDDPDTSAGLAAQVSSPNPAGAARTDGGPEESAVAATLGTRAATVGPDESTIASAIGSASNGATQTGGPDESVVAGAVSGR